MTPSQAAPSRVSETPTAVPTVNPKRLSITAIRLMITAMGDLLKLICYAVTGLSRSRAALQTEIVTIPSICSSLSFRQGHVYEQH